MAMRILLADDHAIIRDGLRSLLENCPDPEMEVVGEAENGRDAIERCNQLLPDIVIMDISMPNLNGIEATHLLTKSNPVLKILALSVHSRKNFVIQMLEAGAAGYILKESAFEEVLLAIRTIRDNKIYLSPEISGVVVERCVHSSEPVVTKDPIHLTAREKEILQLLAEGKSNKEIAMILHRSIKTVDMHRQKLMKKLDIHNLADLTKYALREGITTLE